MKTGKLICKTLKTVRRQVAEANDIPYEATECHHKGDCSGTCPKCEQELRYLENQLAIRQALGKAITVVGISAGLATLTSCHKGLFGPKSVDGYLMPPPTEVENPPLAGIPPAPQGTMEGNDSVQANCEPKTMVAKSDTLKEELIFGEIAETQPSFPGGNSALLQYIQDNVRYPQEALKDNLEGRVGVNFTIERDGSITNVKVVKSVHPILDKEAVRVVESMPKWIPGRRNGESYRVNYHLPITISRK